MITYYRVMTNGSTYRAKTRRSWWCWTWLRSSDAKIIEFDTKEEAEKFAEEECRAVLKRYEDRMARRRRKHWTEVEEKEIDTSTGPVILTSGFFNGDNSPRGLPSLGE